MRRFCRFFITAFLFLSLAGCRGGQVADLQQPGYNKEDFRLKDFDDFKKFRAASKILFPVGTTRAEMDHILVTLNGARSYVDHEDKSPYQRLAKNEYFVRYTRPNNGFLECRFIIVGIFNSKDVLTKEISASYGCTGP